MGRSRIGFIANPKISGRSLHIGLYETFLRLVPVTPVVWPSTWALRAVSTRRSTVVKKEKLFKISPFSLKYLLDIVLLEYGSVIRQNGIQLNVKTKK